MTNDSKDPKNEEGTEDPVINGAAQAEDSTFLVAGEPLEGDALGQAILAIMPGLVPAIGNAFRENTGRNVAFVLVAFAPSGASFVTNVSKPEEMRAAMRAVSDAWADPETPPEQTH